MSIAAKWVCCIAVLMFSSLCTCTLMTKIGQKNSFAATVSAAVFLICMFIEPLIMILWIVRM